MANSNGWGDGAANNTIGWGKGKVNNTIGWGSVYSSSNAGRTDIIGTTATAPVNTVLPVVSGTNFYVADVLTTTDVVTYNERFLNKISLRIKKINIIFTNLSRPDGISYYKNIVFSIKKQ